MKSFFLASLLLFSGCARVDLIINNQGDGAIRDLNIDIGGKQLSREHIGDGESITLKSLKFKKRASPRMNYLNAAGSKIWASAAVEVGPGDKGEVELQRKTKAGSEEFIVHDRRKKIPNKK